MRVTRDIHLTLELYEIETNQVGNQTSLNSDNYRIRCISGFHCNIAFPC